MAFHFKQIAGRRAARLAVLAATLALAWLAADARQKPATQAAPEGDEVKLTANLVIMNVTVTNGLGEFIHNLTPEHFNLREDGKPQKVEFFGAEQTPFAAAILLDASGSMATR